MQESAGKSFICQAVVRQLAGIAILPLLTLGSVLYTGHSAFAGTCTLSDCSGPASSSDVGQVIDDVGPVAVTTQPGFGLSVSGADNGIEIHGVGGVSFVDPNASIITTGGMFGIWSRNDASGDLNITSTGSVTSTTLMGDGIRGDSYGANMSIVAHDTQGQFNGIAANSYGTGATHVVSTGTATGLNDAGIYAYMVSGTDLTIEAANTQGYLQGIVATGGTGALTVTSTGLATSTHGAGIALFGRGSDITLTAADTHGGGDEGIYVAQSGTGNVLVTSTGTAAGVSAGIAVVNLSGSSTTINAVDTSGQFGIAVSSNGGPTTVMSTGTATGTDYSGISVASYGVGDVSITAKDTLGGLYGVYFLGAGAGNANIHSTGSALGTGMDGIYAETGSLGTALNITVNDAQGGRNGVYAVNGSAAGTSGNATSIDVLGHVAGGTGAGIATESGAGVLSTIDVGAHAVVESASGIAIANNGGDSHVIVRAGAVVNGAISLGAGSDTLDLPGGFSGISVLDGGGGGLDTLNLSNAAGASHAGGDIRNWHVLNLDNSALTLTDTGLTVGTPGDLATGVFLRNASTLSLQQDGFALDGNLALDAATALLASTNGVGATTISGTVTNAGAIALSGGGAGSVLTIGGNYIGKGGVIALNTVLGDDTSVTDKVVVKGNTAGTSVLKVTNAGGAGAATTEGIQLVAVSGASNGVFSLSGDYQFNGKPAVVAGAYAYQLYKGNASGSDTNSWYLRSEMADALTDDPAMAPDTGGTAPISTKPLYQAGAPVYEAYPQALLAFNGVQTLQRRVGNRYWSGAAGGAGNAGDSRADQGGAYTDTTGAWARIDGTNNRIESRSSTTGSAFTQNFSRLQAGSDVLLDRRDSGSLIGGGYFQYLHGNTVTRSAYGDGDIATDGYGLGGTLTWYANNGYYVDGQAQVMRFNSDLNSRLASRRLTKGNDATGYALSVESGKRIPLSPEWSLTPQAQLVYSRVDFDRFDDAFGATVRSNDGASLQSRLGVTLDRETRGGKDGMNRSHIYGIANLYYEFLNRSQVNVAGTNFKSRPDRLWGGVGAGLSYNWGKDKYSIYAEGLVNTSLERVGSSRSLQGNMGFRMRW